MARKNPQNFEQSLAELESLVEAMEAGELSLEDALRHFEKGIALASSCQAALQQAEQKVTQLLEKNGELVEKPFASHGSESDD
ncbi:MAG: exodeoxyribonuclease small subunit [Pseudomonadota bacterium]|nr:exodeoxyribonuclease small subunit [Pseudomonadota bacterium]